MNSTTEEDLPWAKAASAPAKGRKAAAPATTATLAATSLELIPVADDDPVNTEEMPRADVVAIWNEQNALLAPLVAEAKGLRVTDINDVAGMERAKELRLGFRSIRLATEKHHKALKEFFLRGGQKVDAFRKGVLSVAEPLEDLMLEQETFAERETARIEQEKRVARAAELQAYTDGSMPPVDLGKLTDDQWAALLSDAKDLKELRVRRLEKEREAAEEAARIEREAAETARKAREEEAAQLRAVNEARRVENERLKAEQEAVLKRLEEERARVAEERRIEEERETKRREADMREREAAEQKHRAERAKLEAEKVAAEQAAKAEAGRAAALAAAERAAQQKLIDEANRKAAELEQAAARREAEARMAEAKAKAEAAEAARKAAAAPDREKLDGFADALLNIVVPPASTPEGKALETKIKGKLNWLSAWIKDETAKL